jgi:hypothetical protein
MKRLIAPLVLLMLTGCFEIEQSINLQKDLSGTADFHLGVDLEPMVVVMAQFAREMEGKTGPATAEEIAKAKADFKKSSKKTSTESDTSRADIEKEMPEGVKLLDYSVKEKEFGMTSDFKFGFDRLSRLVGVKLPSREGDPSKKNVIDSPFEGLELSESGDTFTIRSKAQNPAEEVKEQAADAPKLDAATEKLVRDAFSKMRVVYRISAPFTVVSHNATRREGNTLVWEYDMKAFEEMAKAKKADAGQVRVTYRRN